MIMTHLGSLDGWKAKGGSAITRSGLTKAAAMRSSRCNHEVEPASFSELSICFMINCYSNIVPRRPVPNRDPGEELEAGVRDLAG